MKYLALFFIGMFAAGVVLGVWWVALVTGVLTFITRRSYVVLVAGVLLDLWFATAGDTIFYIGFYTLVFLTTTLIVEYIRSRLLWAS